MQERLIGANNQVEDSDIERTLRPRRLADYVGQTRIKDSLELFVQAARERGEALDHVLLYGPPGLGKTTLAGILANELGVSLRATSGPAIERAGDLAAVLTNLEPHDVLFIDEIHRLNRAVEEILYPAMEDYALDIMIGKGPSARSLRIDLPPFTLVGATTRAGLLASPLRDRFGIIGRLEFYENDELELIVRRSAGILQIEIDRCGAREIAARARGTPRVANRLLKRVRDYAQVRAGGVIDTRVAGDALDMLEVDRLGLDRVDRQLLTTLREKFAGGPVGLDTLAAAVSEEPETVEDVYEPFLMKIGFLLRTPRGRMVSQAACRHLGLSVPKNTAGLTLFDTGLDDSGPDGRD